MVNTFSGYKVMWVLIVVERLSKRFGNILAVDNVSFEVSPGETFGVVGPNGAGKTTLIRVIASILRPTSGKVFVDGLDVAKNPVSVRERIGYLLEEPNLYQRPTARELLNFFGALHGIPKKEREERIDELLRIVGLYDRADSRIATYSKGMRQRLGVARALLHDPKILILDEPTMGLDPTTSRTIRNLITRFGEEGRTILLCTHYMSEAELLCDRVGVMDQGRFVACGSPHELGLRYGGENRIVLQVENHNPGLRELLQGCSQVLEMEQHGKTLTMIVRDVSQAVYEVVEALRSHSYRIEELRTGGATLEDVFIRITHPEVR